MPRRNLWQDRAMRTSGLLVLVLLTLLLMPATGESALTYSGAQMHPWFPGNTSDIRGRELDKLAEAGANTLRMDLPWAAVEPLEKGAYDEDFLRRVDSFVAGARARGIRPILN